MVKKRPGDCPPDRSCKPAKMGKLEESPTGFPLVKGRGKIIGYPKETERAPISSQRGTKEESFPALKKREGASLKKKVARPISEKAPSCAEDSGRDDEDCLLPYVRGGEGARLMEVKHIFLSWKPDKGKTSLESHASREVGLGLKRKREKNISIIEKKDLL